LNTNSSLVSIYIPTHNRKTLLEQAVRSALDQTYPEIEVIVADDASNDGTETMMREWIKDEPRLHYIRLQESKGANVARNKAIMAARGYFVTGLDDDDIMLPERVERLIRSYDETVAFVTSYYYVENDRKRILKRLSRKSYIGLDDLLYVNVVGNQVLTTKEKIMEAGLFDEALSAGQDIDMWIRLVEKYRYAKIVKEPLQVVHICSHGRITRSSRKRRGYWHSYLKHRAKMSVNQRKYRLLGFMLLMNKPLRQILRVIPLHPKYIWLSLGRILKHQLTQKAKIDR